MLGKKIGQSQMFTEDGKRIAITLIKAGPCYITQIKNKDKDGYNSIQLGFDTAKEKKLRFLSEVSQTEDSKNELKLGQEITVDNVLSVGDSIKVTGTSKGKGFAGVVKRWGFHGGPKTHGQGNKHRSPGSIGQGTTPGRVFKGKKMAGRMGGEKVTTNGLKVVNIDNKEGLLTVSGLVPGNRKGLLMITKI